MSIVVVDQFRIAADVYCDVTRGNQSYTDKGFRKVFSMRSLVVNREDEATRPLMGFVGDAVPFDKFLTSLRKALADPKAKMSHINHLKSLMLVGPGGYRVILPMDDGAISLRHDGSVIHHERLKGDLLVFGGSQAKTDLSQAQAWFMPFLDAYRDDLLPGLEIESLMDGHHEVKCETLLTDEEARKHRRKRRHPFLRVKTHFTKRS